MSAPTRRQVVVGAGAAAMTALGAASGNATPPAAPGPMFGLIGKMRAQPGQRDALADAMTRGMTDMPGCLSYVIALDPADADAIWITEVWGSRESHRASLQLPAVRETIARARPLIAGFDSSVETMPLAGIGLDVRRSG